MKRCSVCKRNWKKTAFNFHAGKKDGLQSACRDCNKKRSKAYYRRNRKRHLEVIGARRRSYCAWFRETIAAVKLANPCIICGESETCSLDFHHHTRDKVAGIGTILNLQWNATRLREELEKCVVLCANCHRKFHSGVLTMPKKVSINLAPVAQR